MGPDPLTEIEALAHGDELARLVRRVGLRAEETRSRDLGETLRRLETTLDRADAETSFGNALAALERRTPNASERALLGALLARGVALEPPTDVDAEDRMARVLLWLAAHTGLDAFPALDRALAERAAGLWTALAELLRRIDEGREPSLDRAEAMVGASAMRSTTRDDVRAAASSLAAELSDPALKSALRSGPVAAGGAPGTAPIIVGELEPAPRGPVVTTLLAITGLLFVLRGARLFSRVALSRRAPAEIEVTEGGVRIRAKSELLGRTLGESEQVIPRDGLVRAAREVRYPRLRLYAGLLALAVGGYVGVALFVDGARAASPSLVGQGLLIVAAGVALELGLTSLFPGARGRCRLVFVPRKGTAVCVGGLDVDAAERTLAVLRSA